MTKYTLAYATFEVEPNRFSAIVLVEVSPETYADFAKTFSIREEVERKLGRPAVAVDTKNMKVSGDRKFVDAVTNRGQQFLTSLSWVTADLGMGSLK